jgi:2-haloacid dehalogenase
MRLGDFKVLTFDCYGTLIDWESGIWAALQPLIRKGDLKIARDAALESFARHESRQEQTTPTMRYSELLALVHSRLAEEWNVAPDAELDRTFGGSVPHWPAFHDSPAALAYLKQHYKLVILSNIDRTSFRASNMKLGVAFDAVYTAEDIGSYKPDPRNFAYLLRHLQGDIGLERKDVLHTAQSLFHDHVPALAAGLARAWIDRRQGQAGSGATIPLAERPSVDFHFPSMAALVDAHRAGA